MYVHVNNIIYKYMMFVMFAMGATSRNMGGMYNSYLECYGRLRRNMLVSYFVYLLDVGLSTCL